jgi:UDP-N-acetyl-D-mannosaminuronic acid dehydrogenase
MKTICVVGLGYIGLPTAALLASNGYQVFGVDSNLKVVEIINQGLIHIIEPDLAECVKSSVASGNLKAFNMPHAADIFIICVPTPFYENKIYPKPNIDYVLAAIDSIKTFLKPGNSIILESTSPVGTTEKIALILSGHGVDVSKINIAYCPERVLPGRVMVELLENDRVVGGLTKNAGKVIADFYRSFICGDVLETDAPTAEMCKLAENSYRDVNIAFANELSILSANAGIDVWNLIKLANRHPRVNILQPGVGVGGHCIAVDPWFIVDRDPENAKLIRTAREVNDAKANWTINQIQIAIDEVEASIGCRPRVACLGLSFKPDIDDLRESPALYIVTTLMRHGYDISVVEPNIQTHDSFGLVQLDWALSEANIVVILVRHKEFMQIKKFDKSQIILDYCGAT